MKDLCTSANEVTMLLRQCKQPPKRAWFDMVPRYMGSWHSVGTIAMHRTAVWLQYVLLQPFVP